MPRILRPLALCLLLALVFPLLCSATSTAATAAVPACSAKAFCLLECEGGEVLVAHNESERLPMASTTKIMTALVVLEQLPLDRVVRVPACAVGTEGSSIYLYKDEQITVETLLYALMLSSANDAAVALAVESAGSVERFCELMNQKATALGLADTHFANPHGLPCEGHYTTARDLARLTAAALQNKVFAEIVATRRYTAPQSGTDATRLFLNHNKLLRQLDGAIGVKTGYTKAAGRCLVSAVRRDGMTLIAVTLNAPSDWQDHTSLHEWGFATFERYAPDPPSLTLPVVGASVDTLTLIPDGKPSLLLPREHGEITCHTEAPRFLFAGVKKGARVGRLLYRLDGRVIAEIPLVCADTAETQKPQGLWARLKNLFGK
ncbi:MAG: D-alanyl-D-alanine carboxypeptidase [Clostridia bacterium]|nr:D-alanyl-D-alanine carboxypeptidase [Clostridia bacterium]